MKEELPTTGLKAILKHWKPDLAASASVFLVALPLSLGIAIASGAPPMAGIIAAIIGGVVTTFFRGSYVAINGPAAGLIVVILSGVGTLADENGSGFPYVLAAIVCAGAIQMILGIFKWGKLGDLFPTSVVNGMLATIGITILVKQFHVAFGNNENTGNILETFRAIPDSLINLHPFVTIIAVVSLAILIVHPRLTNRYIKTIPAPLLVMIISIPMVFIFNFIGSPEANLLGRPAYIDADHLIHIPANLQDSIMFPNFSKITYPQFWLTVISIVLVASIETLISTKAVDKLDHYQRRTNLNKDLFGVGLSTTVSGLIGGLPIITVIVRSSVNVNHHAKTKWSNFYHGILLAIFVFLFPFIINKIPLASLAAILIYTGYKLASPKLFKAVMLRGWEQLFIMITTLIASLSIDLLWGIIIGIFTTLLIHWARSRLSLSTFFRHLVHTEINVSEESKKTMHVEIKGIANFAIILKLINSLRNLGNGHRYIVNFSRTKLVDSTVLDFIHEHREKYFTNTDFEFVGLDVHKTSSSHPLALHVLEKPMQKRLKGRENDIYHFGQKHGYKFNSEINWEIDHFKKFRFFEFHFVEYHRNRLTGVFDNNISWEISDLTYNDGILLAREEHHITVMMLFFEKAMQDFSITKDNIRQLKSLIRNGRSSEKVDDKNEDLSHLLSNSASYYIEAIGNEVLLYRKERLLSTKEIIDLHDFAKKFCKVMAKED